MWVNLALIGSALLCTLLVAFSVANLRANVPFGGRYAVVYTLISMAVLWCVLGAMLAACHGAEVPPGFVLMVYVMGGIAELASVYVLANHSTDPIAVVAFRAGIVAIPLVLVLFAGFNL